MSVPPSCPDFLIFPVTVVRLVLESAIMSWQEYVDDHLMCELPNGGSLKSAAIVGSDGGVWAQSPDFPTLSNDEVRALEGCV